MGIINILHKCEYSHRNFFNASCFNVNSGSADVTHTFVSFSRLSLSESILMSVFALSSDNQGDSLTFGVVVLIRLLGKGEIMWVNFRDAKSATCTLRFGAGLISWDWYFWYVIVQGIFSVFFWTTRLIIS